MISVSLIFSTILIFFIIYVIINSKINTIVLGDNLEIVHPVQNKNQYKYIKLENNLHIMLMSYNSELNFSAEYSQTEISKASGASIVMNLNSFENKLLFKDSFKIFEYILISLIFSEKVKESNDLINNLSFDTIISNNNGKFSSYNDNNFLNFFMEIETQYYSASVNTLIRGLMRIKEMTYDEFSVIYEKVVKDIKLFEKDNINSSISNNKAKINDKNVKDDVRELQILKSLALEEHPFSQFSLINTNSNKDSLFDLIKSQDKQFIFKEVKSIFNYVFNADNLRISLYSNMNLENIQYIAEEAFNQIPKESETSIIQYIKNLFTFENLENKNNKTSSNTPESKDSNTSLPKTASKPSLPFSSNLLGSFIWYKKEDLYFQTNDTLEFLFTIKSINNIHQVYNSLEKDNIGFTLNKNKLVKPSVYVSYMLKHSGKGSLKHALMMQNYITDYNTGVILDFKERKKSNFNIKNNQDFILYSISMNLTSKGFKSIQEISEIVFHYIHLLQDNSNINNVLNDLEEINRLNFIFKDEKLDDDYYKSYEKEILEMTMNLFDYRHNNILNAENSIYYDEKFSADLSNEDDNEEKGNDDLFLNKETTYNNSDEDLIDKSKANNAEAVSSDSYRKKLKTNKSNRVSSNNSYIDLNIDKASINKEGTRKLNAKIIKDFVDQLSSNNLFIILSTKEDILENKNTNLTIKKLVSESKTKIDPKYKTRYIINKLPNYLLQVFQISDMPINDKYFDVNPLMLRSNNKFISQETTEIKESCFNIRNKEERDSCFNTTNIYNNHPRAIINSTNTKIWFKENKALLIPRTNIRIALINKKYRVASNYDNTVFKLFFYYIKNSIDFELNDLKSSGNTIDVQFGDDLLKINDSDNSNNNNKLGFYINLIVYNDLLTQVLEKLFNVIYHGEINPSLFELSKNQFIENILQEKSSDPLFKSRLLYNKLIRNGNYSAYFDYKKLLIGNTDLSFDINYDSFSYYLGKIRNQGNQLSYLMYVEGNTDKSVIQSIEQIIQPYAYLNTDQESEDANRYNYNLDNHKNKILETRLIQNKNLYYTVNDYKNETENFLQVFYQLGKLNEELLVISKLTKIILEDSFQHFSKSLEDISYINYSVETISDIVYLTFTVKTKKDLRLVESSIDSYLIRAKGVIDRLMESDFQDIKNYLFERLEKEYSTMFGLIKSSDFSWNRILYGEEDFDYMFDLGKKAINFCKKATKDDVASFFSDFSNFNIKKLTIALDSQETNSSYNKFILENKNYNINIIRGLVSPFNFGICKNSISRSLTNNKTEANVGVSNSVVLNNDYKDDECKENKKNASISKRILEKQSKLNTRKYDIRKIKQI